MHTLLITIIASYQRVDLQVPGEILASDLVSALLAVATEPSTWALRTMDTGVPLPATSSLLDAGVMDGAVLVLEKTRRLC